MSVKLEELYTLELRKSYNFLIMTNLDEFTDRYIWDRETITNNEDQYYAPKEVNDAFTLNAAGLTITASHTPTRTRPLVGNQPYVSGILTTRDKGHSQLFGYWEGSFRLPSARGAWPAFWLLPTHGSWPEGIAVLSEIDIMEAVHDVLEGKYHGTSHSNETGELVSSKNNAIATGRELTAYFHKYGLSWDKDWLIWFFEGVEVLRRPTPADMKDDPRHFLLNLAVGGWGGHVMPTDYPSKAKFEIEYVNIYDIEPVDGVIAPPPPLPPIKPGLVTKEQIEANGLDGDVIYMLNDQRFVTKRDIDLVTEYLIQSTN